jgi:hypothetical protein
MTLNIQVPPTYPEERAYIIDVIFNEFLGLDYRTETVDGYETIISLRGDPLSKKIILPDVLFQTLSCDWLTPKALPVQPLECFVISEYPAFDACLVDNKLPVLFGKRLSDGVFVKETEEGIYLGIDILGSAFFMLTRFEEIIKQDRDSRERFPARASIAFQENFLTRPIINEYLELLWQLFQRPWPNLARKLRLPRILLSHDVDIPLCISGFSLPHVIRASAGDIFVRKDVRLAMRRLLAIASVYNGNLDKDICNTFDFLMTVSESFSLESTFYFITDHSKREIEDPSYEFNSAWIKQLLSEIHNRGHKIGLHPSYSTFRDLVKTRHEWGILRDLCNEMCIDQISWGGRQHYLRWENPTNWQIWDDIGIDYDDTLTFPEQVGFRCGICYEYPVFNLKTRQRLRLHEGPLIIMEGTLFDYMKLSFGSSFQLIKQLYAVCKKFRGDFTFLWHNHNLISKRQRAWYKEIIAYICDDTI